MKIILAKNAGFCWGVKRVVKITEEEIKKSSSKIFTHGPLIHNQEVIKKLEEKGVSTLQTDLPEEELSKLPSNSTIIIRAHGVPPNEKEKLTRAGLNVIDGTCPHVVKIQKFVADAFLKNRFVIILGDKGHAEVVGLLGFCPGRGEVVSDEADLNLIPKNVKITVVAQSTLDKSSFDRLTRIIQEKWRDCKIINTRCDATTRRQDEAIALCGKVDLMIIIGGKNSANTKRLAQICADSGVKTYHIENKMELDDINLDKVECVSVTAGASTPEWIINSVIDKLSKK